MSPSTNSSNTYPSAEGSNVHRSSSFWSLPILVSSPACSVQSMVTNNMSNQADHSSYDVLVEYPSQSLQYQILDEFSRWFVEASLTFLVYSYNILPACIATLRLLTIVMVPSQTLYPKLLAVEEVWCKMEEMAAKLAQSKMEDNAANVCMQAAHEHVSAVMEAQHLFLDVVVYLRASGRVKWRLFMHGDVVFQGEAENKSEVLCAAFFEQRRASLKHMPH